MSDFTPKQISAVTVGGATLDSIAIIDSELIERMAMRNADASFLLLEEGRKVEAAEISNHCGGGAINAAVGLARLGCKTSTVVKMGDDLRAEEIMERLQSEGISDRWTLTTSEANTGASVIVSSHDRDAAIFTFRGANTLLRPADLKAEMFATDLVYITGLSNQSAECFPEIVRHAKSNGALIASNPGIRQLSKAGADFYETISNIDVLCVNVAEGSTLVPRLATLYGEGGRVPPLDPDTAAPKLITQGLHAGGFDMTLSGFVSALLEVGLKYVVVTAGAEGSYIGHDDRITFCPTIPIEVYGTAGAGDAFSSTVSAMLAMGYSVENTLRLATHNAASVVGYADTQTGLLKYDDLIAADQKTGSDLVIQEWPL